MFPISLWQICFRRWRDDSLRWRDRNLRCRANFLCHQDKKNGSRDGFLARVTATCAVANPTCAVERISGAGASGKLRVEGLSVQRQKATCAGEMFPRPAGSFRTLWRFRPAESARRTAESGRRAAESTGRVRAATWPPTNSTTHQSAAGLYSSTPNLRRSWMKL